MRGRLVLLTAVALVALGAWLLLGNGPALDQPTADQSTAAVTAPASLPPSLPGSTSEPVPPVKSSKDQPESPASARPGRGDVPQDAQGREQHPTVPTPTLPPASEITDTQIRRLLEADLNGQSRPAQHVAAAAEQATRSWLIADIKTAGLWTQPRIRAAIAITPTDADDPTTQVLVKVVWTAIRDGQVELHRTDVSAHLIDQKWQLTPEQR